MKYRYDQRTYLLHHFTLHPLLVLPTYPPRKPSNIPQESSNIVSRIIWIFLFLCGTAAVIWQLHGVINKYLEHPVATTISIGYSTLDFPTITICNMNPIRASMVSQDEQLEDYVEEIYETTGQSDYANKPPPTKPPKNKRKVFTGHFFLGLSIHIHFQ